jgi:hypothetical protein
MAQESQKNNSVLIIIAIFGVVGTVIAATITVTGNYTVEKMRQEAELTRIALVSTNEAQAKATPKLITITLTNDNCNAQDYYVDGNLIVSSIEPNAKVPFNVIPGEHQVLSCSSNTNFCGDTVQVNWTASTTAAIKPASNCPIAITLTNYNCMAQDYYIDGNLMVSSIKPNAKVIINVIPGDHQVYSCNPGTSTCGDAVQANWTTSTTAAIGLASDCPIAITLTNYNCMTQDYYVDSSLTVSSIEPNAKVLFNVIPGEHQVYSCNPGTSTCGNAVQVNWITSTTAGIGPASSCP